MPTQTLARIYVNRKPIPPDAPWPIQRSRAKKLTVNGNQVEVHSPTYPGTDYCRQCEKQAVKPHLYLYESREFWRCTCGKMNYIPEKI